MNEKVIRVKDEFLKLTFIKPNIVRFHFSKDKNWIKKYSFVIDYSQLDLNTDIKINEDEKFYEFTSSVIKIRINKKNGKIEIFNKDGLLIHSDYEDKGYVREGDKVFAYKEIKKEIAFLGFGERMGNLNKKSERLINWNTDESNHKFTADPLYQSHPFFIAWNPDFSYGLFFDDYGLSYFDMGNENDSYYYFCSEDGELDYYFIYGKNPKEVIENYTHLTGRCYMPPLWSLGFQQSKWSYDRQEKVLNLAKKFRERNIPCDVIYLDIDYMKGYRVFTVNKKRFPDFKKMLNILKNVGFKVVLIVDPGVKVDRNYEVCREGLENNYFCKQTKGKIFTGYVWPGKSVFPDFLQEKVRYWWGEKHRELIESGVSGFWNDMNEPSIFSLRDYILMKILLYFFKIKEPPSLSEPRSFEDKIRKIKAKTMPDNVIHGEDEEVFHYKIHNIYGLLMTKATYEGFRRINPNNRPLIISRAGFSGIQRYSAVWCGDNKSTWENLYSSIITLQNLSISGVPFVGEDVGGFWGDCEGELFVRWIQLGVFYPFFRVHSALNTREQEPWSFGDEKEKIVREFINLRYRLIPYIYSLFYEAKEKGIPLIRSLILEFPEEREAINYFDEFMFGPFLLICPIYEKGRREREVYLPKGSWYDFYTGKKFRGNCKVKIYAPLNKIPIFVREGALIPMWDLQNYIGKIAILLFVVSLIVNKPKEHLQLEYTLKLRL
ncbi:MAG: TIM-barrel domain-containing protein [Dictyoglomus sp.]